MLNQIIHGEPSDQPPLVIVHGLYGSARNWGVIAKRLSDERQVIAVDQRNHGQSPWNDSHSYHDMANDLAEVLRKLSDEHGQAPDLLGHSMGGKAAMVAALENNALVRRLIVADIAPVAYQHDQSQYIKAMQQIDLSAIKKRSDAVEQLAQFIDNPSLLSFFTQSLDVAAQKWRLNLDVLEKEMPKILGFPECKSRFCGPCLFIAGKQSDYILPEHRGTISSLFPKARIVKLSNAGHWLHADAPRAFEAAVRQFITAKL